MTRTYDSYFRWFQQQQDGWDVQQLDVKNFTLNKANGTFQNYLSVNMLQSVIMVSEDPTTKEMISIARLQSYSRHLQPVFVEKRMKNSLIRDHELSEFLNGIFHDFSRRI